MIFRKYWRPWLVVVIAATAPACSGHLKPTVTASEFRNIAPISKSVLLLVPDEFAAHVYTTQDQRKVSFKFGESTAELLPTLLDRVFTTVEVREVQGDAASAASSSAGVTGRDYVAIPKFVRTSSALTSGGINIETALSVEFVAADRSRTITAAGSGKGSTHLWAQAALQTAGGIALRSALQSLIADINTKRESF